MTGDPIGTRDAFAAIAMAALAFGPVLSTLVPMRAIRLRRLFMLALGLLAVRYLGWRVTQTVPWGETDVASLYMQFILLVELAWVLEIGHAYGFYWWHAPASDRLDHWRPSPVPAALRGASIDVYVPTYNEGPEILERTILAAKAIDWQGPVTVHVLDDGRRDWLRAMCERLEANWIVRPDNAGAKAGNVNHALGVTSGEFIFIVDADFLSHPQAIHRLMPSMDDPTVAIVQAPQKFYNDDPVARTLGVGDLLGDEQRLFFDRLLPARDGAGMAFFCGCCALLRREPVVALGGLPTGSVTEDILLSVHLRHRGWQTRYVPAGVALGLAPESIDAFFVQRRRWGRGAIQMMYLRSGLLGRGLSLRDRIGFAPVYWLTSHQVRFVSLLVPQLFLLFGLAPLANADEIGLLYYQGPLVAALVGLSAYFFSRRWAPFVNGIWHDLMALRLAPALVKDVFLPFSDRRFHVTPKGRGARGRRTALFPLVVAALVALTLAALVRGAVAETDPLRSLTMFWCVVNLVRLMGVLVVLWRDMPLAGDPLLDATCSVRRGLVLVGDGPARSLQGRRMTETRLLPAEGVTDPVGARVAVREADGRLTLLARLGEAGALEFLSWQARSRLLSLLVAERLDEDVPYRPAAAVGRLATELFALPSGRNDR